MWWLIWQIINLTKAFLVKNFYWKNIDKIEPLKWWKLLGQCTSLSSVAVKILSTPATSAATERSFSTFSWIHSKKRNKLTTDRAGKLCTIAHNYKLQQQQIKPKIFKGYVLSWDEDAECPPDLVPCSPSTSQQHIEIPQLSFQSESNKWYEYWFGIIICDHWFRVKWICFYLLVKMIVMYKIMFLTNCILLS